MSTDTEQHTDAPDSDARPDLGHRARAIGVVVWSSFLAACAGTMFFFAFIAPADIIGPAEGGGWQDHLGVYTLGFFGLWCLGAVASAIALYLHDVFHTPGSRS
jgi:hypothetical protein